MCKKSILPVMRCAFSKRCLGGPGRSFLRISSALDGRSKDVQMDVDACQKTRIYQDDAFVVPDASPLVYHEPQSLEGGETHCTWIVSTSEYTDTGDMVIQPYLTSVTSSSTATLPPNAASFVSADRN